LSPPPVHVVVPVYRGITLTRRCLDSLAASDLPADCQVTLIDDASPEDGMAAMLAAFVEAVPIAVPSGPSWELLRNAANLGFVASANRGMGHRPGHDVVLLNSDTEVPPGWLQRLRSAAYRRKNIGTVTPFSNCGSLASYPAPNVENALPANLSLERLDRLFQTANTGTNVDIPIGVGFCFFIRRDCLDGTGAFDEAAFGKGYGEENDFCLRASQRGWTHVLATDCFVYHKGHGSFGEEKDERVRQAYALLVERHPHYPALIQRHFADDPARPFRFRVDLLRLADSTPGIRLAVVSAQQTTADPAAPAGAAPVLQLSPVRAGHFVLRWLNEGEAFKLWFRLPEEFDALRELLRALPVADVQGDDPSLTGALSAPPEASVAARTPAELFDLVARHGAPRFNGWPALQRALAAHGLRLGGSHLLRPLAALLPEATRSRVRNWIKANRP
jgi:GT2 family glycosyltransferase